MQEGAKGIPCDCRVISFLARTILGLSFHSSQGHKKLSLRGAGLSLRGRGRQSNRKEAGWLFGYLRKAQRQDEPKGIPCDCRVIPFLARTIFFVISFLAGTIFLFVIPFLARTYDCRFCSKIVLSLSPKLSPAGSTSFSCFFRR